MAGRRSSNQVEKRFVRKDGSMFRGRLTVHALQDESGQVTHHIGLVEDVSEQRRAEEALQASTERFQAVLSRRGRHRAHRSRRHHPVGQSLDGSTFPLDLAVSEVRHGGSAAGSISGKLDLFRPVDRDRG